MNFLSANTGLNTIGDGMRNLASLLDDLKIKRNRRDKTYLRSSVVLTNGFSTLYFDFNQTNNQNPVPGQTLLKNDAVFALHGVRMYIGKIPKYPNGKLRPGVGAFEQYANPDIFNGAVLPNGLATQAESVGGIYTGDLAISDGTDFGLRMLKLSELRQMTDTSVPLMNGTPGGAPAQTMNCTSPYTSPAASEDSFYALDKPIFLMGGDNNQVQLTFDSQVTDFSNVEFQGNPDDPAPCAVVCIDLYGYYLHNATTCPPFANLNGCQTCIGDRVISMKSA